MGFFDSFKAGVDEQREQISKSKEYSNYKTVKDRNQEHYDDLNKNSDGALLGKMNSDFTSIDDKKIVDEILRERGYIRNEKGKYSRT